MAIKPIKLTDYEGDTAELFIEQYRNSNIQELLKPAMAGFQDLENALYDFYSKLPLSTATGQTLDEWGDHFNVLRAGLSDNVYRAKIYAQILSFTSSGRRDKLFDIITLLTQAIKIRAIENYPHKVGYDIQTDLGTISVSELKEAITRALGDTIGLDDLLIISPVVYFGFKSDADAEGYSTVDDPTSGGFYSVVV